MKITDIKVYIMDAYRTNWTFIKVETDEGLYGWGEASLGTQEMALKGCVEDLKRLIVGRDPREIEKMHFEVYRDIYWKGGPVLMSAISGIEMAMWDIVGKYFNTPVYNLFGGKMRDRVKMYANGWFSGSKTPENFAKKAKETVALGVKALKWDPFGKAHMTLTKEEMHTAVEIVGAVREAVGDNVELLIECHGRFNPYTAIEISRELAPFKPMFLEEPCPPDNIEAIAKVKRKSLVPIAAGERVYSIYGFEDLFSKDAVDIVQPDMFHTGGMMECKKIAAATPNFLIHEIMINDGSFRKKITNEEVVFEDGSILIGDKPGLGIDVNIEAVEERPYHPINLRHYTGTLTEIRPKDDTIFYFKGIGENK